MASDFGAPGAASGPGGAASAVLTPPTSDHPTPDTLTRPDASPPSVHNNYHAHRQNHTPSKLPAYRFVDLKTESLGLPALLQQQQNNGGDQLAGGIPPSPVSPDLEQHNKLPEPLQDKQTEAAHGIEHSSPLRSRASTFQTAVTSAPDPQSASPKRSQSLDSPTAGDKVKKPSVADSVQSYHNNLQAATDSTETIVAARLQQRRAPASSTANASEAPAKPSPSLITQGLQSIDNSQSAPGADDVTKEWAQGQRELLLPKSVRTSGDDKRASVARRPPVSYKPPSSANVSGGTTVVPPIRSFRSSGSRKSSLNLDLDMRSLRAYDAGNDVGDSTHRDRTLRALEGRQDWTPPDSAVDRGDTDDSGDVFLKIAREEQRRSADENGSQLDAQSAVTRVRSTHRRPLSAAIASYQPTSPPQISRRLSDQQDTSRNRGYSDEASGERLARSSTFRGTTRDRTSEDYKNRVNGSSLRPPPLTPRTSTFQDGTADSGSAYSRRRQSLTDSRMAALKQPAMPAFRHNQSYNSSPLVPKSLDPQKHDSPHVEGYGREGTESSAASAAPSTVWDELDDMKSRIRQLERSGKLPPTSGAAMSRASDERPPTANTNATTMSSSPKRGSGSLQHADVVSTTSSARDGHPLLQSALQKSKPLLSHDVYSALETATTDALALATIIGTPGQPGPISSGASTIGGSGATVTDRQLRRKADSICRSLTELCLALSDNATPHIKPQQVIAPPEEIDDLNSPTVTKFTGAATTRRPSAAPAVADRTPAVLATSPRGMSKLEERRNSMLLSALPTPTRTTTTGTPQGSTEGGGRRTSLLIARTRRAGTEEPEDAAGRKSSLLRTRRAGTEEPPEEPSGRKSSVLRSRRMEHDEDEARLRSPSRAVTEVAGTKAAGGREYTSNVPMPSIEQTSLASSALPRRRMPSSVLNTRLVQPSFTSGLATRRFVERATPDRETMSAVEPPSEERDTRRYSALGRTGSLNARANRESMMTNSSTTAQAGGYR